MFSAACVLFSHRETERERVVCVCACEARVFNENRNDDYCGEITTPREEILELVASSSLGHVCLFFLLSLEFRVFVFFFFSCLLLQKGQKTRLSTNKKKSVCLKKDVGRTFTVSLSLSLSFCARVCVCIFLCVCVCIFFLFYIVCSCVCVCVFVFLTFLSSQKAAS